MPLPTIFPFFTQSTNANSKFCSEGSEGDSVPSFHKANESEEYKAAPKAC